VTFCSARVTNSTIGTSLLVDYSSSTRDSLLFKSCEIANQCEHSMASLNSGARCYVCGYGHLWLCFTSHRQDCGEGIFRGRGHGEGIFRGRDRGVSMYRDMGCGESIYRARGRGESIYRGCGESI